MFSAAVRFLNPVFKLDFLSELGYALLLLVTNRFKTEPYWLSTCLALEYISELFLVAGRLSDLLFSLLWRPSLIKYGLWILVPWISGSADVLVLSWAAAVYVFAVEVGLVCLGSKWGDRTGLLENRFNCRQGNAVLTGFSVVGGVGVRLLRHTGTDGKLAVPGACSLVLGDGVTSGAESKKKMKTVSISRHF